MALKDATQSKTSKKRFEGGLPAQDRFLTELAAAHQTVNLYLINGVKLTGEILAFDQFVILLSGSSQDHVYKRAVSTIQPVSQAAVKSLNRHEPSTGAPVENAKRPTIVRVRPRRVIDKSLL